MPPAPAFGHPYAGLPVPQQDVRSLAQLQPHIVPQMHMQSQIEQVASSPLLPYVKCSNDACPSLNHPVYGAHLPSPAWASFLPCGCTICRECIGSTIANRVDVGAAPAHEGSANGGKGDRSLDGVMRQHAPQKAGERGSEGEPRKFFKCIRCGEHGSTFEPFPQDWSPSLLARQHQQQPSRALDIATPLYTQREPLPSQQQVFQHSQQADAAGQPHVQPHALVQANPGMHTSDASGAAFQGRYGAVSRSPPLASVMHGMPSFSAPLTAVPDQAYPLQQLQHQRPFAREASARPHIVHGLPPPPSSTSPSEDSGQGFPTLAHTSSTSLPLSSIPPRAFPYAQQQQQPAMQASESIPPTPDLVRSATSDAGSTASPSSPISPMQAMKVGPPQPYWNPDENDLERAAKLREREGAAARMKRPSQALQIRRPEQVAATEISAGAGSERSEVATAAPLKRFQSAGDAVTAAAGGVPGVEPTAKRDGTPTPVSTDDGTLEELSGQIAFSADMAIPTVKAARLRRNSHDGSMNSPSGLESFERLAIGDRTIDTKITSLGEPESDQQQPAHNASKSGTGTGKHDALITSALDEDAAQSVSVISPEPPVVALPSPSSRGCDNSGRGRGRQRGSPRFQSRRRDASAPLPSFEQPVAQATSHPTTEDPPAAGSAPPRAPLSLCSAVNVPIGLRADVPSMTRDRTVTGSSGGTSASCITQQTSTSTSTLSSTPNQRPPAARYHARPEMAEERLAKDDAMKATWWKDPFTGVRRPFDPTAKHPGVSMDNPKNLGVSWPILIVSLSQMPPGVSRMLTPPSTRADPQRALQGNGDRNGRVALCVRGRPAAPASPPAADSHHVRCTERQDPERIHRVRQ